VVRIAAITAGCNPASPSEIQRFESSTTHQFRRMMKGVILSASGQELLTSIHLSVILGSFSGKTRLSESRFGGSIPSPSATAC
jgi:hypothetical protein